MPSAHAAPPCTKSKRSAVSLSRAVQWGKRVYRMHGANVGAPSGSEGRNIRTARQFAVLIRCRYIEMQNKAPTASLPRKALLQQEVFVFIASQ